VTTKKIILPTFLTYTLGCRVNQAEASAISNQLTACGFQFFTPDLQLSRSPALVIINTCAVTQKAERESRKAIHHYKRVYPQAKIIALGCAAKFVKDADLIIENPQKSNAIKIILKKFSFAPRRCQAKYLTPNPYHLSDRALVKIQEGCDQFCHYCIVPYLRGKPKSTKQEEIICQINKLVEEGIKEIILCGINLSLYGIDLTPPISLITLIKKILSQTKAERISLSSIEPEYLYENREFAELFIKEPRLSKYFHLALQSGSSETIKVMGRKTDLTKLMKTIHFIKEKCPKFTFRADIIVGFPTETEKNFQETLDFIKKVPITFCHVFRYSVRPGTLAAKKIKTKEWTETPPAIKKERAKKVADLVKKINAEK